MQTSIETIDTQFGRFSVDMVLDKKIGTRLKEGTYHQADTIALLQKFITPESVVVDIGAHIGTETIPLARLARKVIAFEPAPDSFSLLKINIEQNGLVADVRNMGLSSRAGSASVRPRSENNAGANTLLQGEGLIEISTLDQEVEHMDVLKVDVEGMEFAVFEGGAQLLARSKPIIFAEINLSALRDHHSTPGRIEQFLRNLGYDLYIPLTNKNGDPILGKIVNLSLITVCIAPRAWVTRSTGAPFDILAIHHSATVPLPVISSSATLLKKVVENIKGKAQRFF